MSTLATPKPWYRSGYFRATVVVGVLALILIAPGRLTTPAQGSSSSVRISVHLSGTKLTNLIAAPRPSTCTEVVHASKRSASFAADKVPESGTISLSWELPVNAPSGKWTFDATCAHAGKKLRGSEVLNLALTGNGQGSLVANPRALSSEPGGKGGGNQSCVNVIQPANGGVVCFIGDPFAVYDNGGDVGQCTWYAAGMRPDLYNIVTGNAGQWLTEAKGKKPEGTTPVVGSIAVNTTADMGVGHVAYVAGVEDNGTELVLDEANVRVPEVYLNVVTPASDFSGYIYGGPATAPTPVTPGPPAPTPPTPTAAGNETTGGSADTWTNYSNAGGSEGPIIPAYDTIAIACRVQGYKVPDSNTWWYQIASTPWSDNYYVTADAFYNNGATSGSLANTPFFDPNIPVCGSSSPPPTTTTTTTTPPTSTTTTSTAPTSTTTTTTQPGGSPTTSTTSTTSTTTTTTTLPPPPQTWSETTGGVAHTWTNYVNAGGTEGPAIAAFQTVQISCRLTGFKVADGNNWWYKIASTPWSNAYYVSADAFYNNGSTSGSLTGTPFFDPSVALC